MRFLLFLLVALVSMFCGGERRKRPAQPGPGPGPGPSTPTYEFLVKDSLSYPYFDGLFGVSTGSQNKHVFGGINAKKTVFWVLTDQNSGTLGFGSVNLMSEAQPPIIPFSSLFYRNRYYLLYSYAIQPNAQGWNLFTVNTNNGEIISKAGQALFESYVVGKYFDVARDTVFLAGVTTGRRVLKIIPPNGQVSDIEIRESGHGPQACFASAVPGFVHILSEDGTKIYVETVEVSTGGVIKTFSGEGSLNLVATAPGGDLFSMAAPFDGRGTAYLFEIDMVQEKIIKLSQISNPGVLNDLKHWPGVGLIAAGTRGAVPVVFAFNVDGDLIHGQELSILKGKKVVCVSPNDTNPPSCLLGGYYTQSGVSIPWACRVEFKTTYGGLEKTQTQPADSSEIEGSFMVN